MANDIFSRAKAYRKLHPRKTWAECVKACAGKTKRVGGVKKVATKKVTVKVHPKKRSTTISISGISLQKTQHELSHQKSLVAALHKHQELLKQKGLTHKEKMQLRKDIAHYKGLIAASKKHVSILKRTI